MEYVIPAVATIIIEAVAAKERKETKKQNGNVERGWHGGGSSNNTHIGVEMCEPGCIKYTVGAILTDLLARVAALESA